MGIGMGAGLYDAAFATLGRIYGRDARAVISALTLVAGFSSTICWPLSSYLLEHFGWRSTCFFYAAVQLLASLPIHCFMLPAHPTAVTQPVPRSSASAVRLAPDERHIFLLLAAALTIAGVISAIVSIHILSMLQDLGTTAVAAVGIGALIGPSQVGARALEVLLGHRYHAIWTLVASAAVSAIGLALLLVGPPLLALAVILYGAGTGIGWIARGTVPLALFGPENYPALLGRLALPSTVSMALAPFFGAVIIQRGGAMLTLFTLTALAIMNVALVAVLFQKSARRV
jgi:predicted MFS family arabinose efflux permease